MQGILEKGKKKFFCFWKINGILILRGINAEDKNKGADPGMKCKKMPFSKKDANYIKAGILLLILTGVLQITARRVPGFGQWYAVTVYPWIVGICGRIWGFFPCSVVEIGIYLFLGGILVYGIRHIKEVWRLMSRVLFLLALSAFLFTTNCGINYYRRPFSSYLTWEVRESSTEELLELCRFLTEQVNETANQETYERNWNQEARKTMGNLGDTYPELGGYYPAPKGVLVSWILSVQQLCGIYSPFTVEANYNQAMPAYNIPHTMCHELSHLKGFMREDEANFIGYLACIESEDEAFQYSGYLTGWVYAGNALAKADMESYTALYQQLDEQAKKDLQYNSEFWNRYEGKVAEVSNKMNDTYLKMNDQSDGVQSYGRVVDLMLAYNRQQK